MMPVAYLFCSIALALVMMAATGPDATWLQWPYVLASSAAWFAITIAGYGPVASAIFWEVDRKKREKEVRWQEELIDRRLSQLRHRFPFPERIVELEMKAHRFGLTAKEREELSSLTHRETTQFRRAAE